MASQLRAVVVAVLAVSICACGGTVRVDQPSTRVAVLSAFPAEHAPLIAQATITDTMVIEGRTFRIGVLGGVPVVMGLTGIGLLNAAATTRLVLDRFAVAGVVVSAVAGSTLQIGDVAVPVAWALKDGTSFSANKEWLDLAAEIAVPGKVALERCTTIANMPAHDPVCFPEDPAIVVGGVGQSADPFGNNPFPCQPKGNDVFGCDVAPGSTASESVGDQSARAPFGALEAAAPIVEDMETAAIAREAAARGVPFIAFRAVSDGAGDPLGLPGFPTQFFAYYRFAARNAAAATVAFLERLAVRSSTAD